jgi:Domain of unknown function (DUF4266)
MRRAAIGLLLALGSLACVGDPVRPWERDVLSHRDMAWDPDPVESTLDRHVQFSKEGSLAGGIGGGGGCGCN